MLAINTYKMVQHLKNAGMNEQQAVAIQETVVSMREADIEKLATKDDIFKVESKLQGEIRGLKENIHGEISGLKADINELKAHVQRIDNEFKLVRAESKADHEKSRADFQKALLALAIAVIGVVIASAKFIK